MQRLDLDATYEPLPRSGGLQHLNDEICSAAKPEGQLHLLRRRVRDSADHAQAPRQSMASQTPCLAAVFRTLSGVGGARPRWTVQRVRLLLLDGDVMDPQIVAVTRQVLGAAHARSGLGLSLFTEVIGSPALAEQPDLGGAYGTGDSARPVTRALG